MFEIAGNIFNDEWYIWERNGENVHYLRVDGVISDITLANLDIFYHASKEKAELALQKYLNPFKVGDKVRCINEGVWKYQINDGIVYTVKSFDENGKYVQFEEIFGGWAIHRFELVKEEPKFKVGDKVRCLKSYDNQFTKDKIYTVAAIFQNYLNVTLDDLGSTTNGWNITYFELVIEPKWNIEEAMVTWREGNISLREALQQAFDAGKNS